MNKQLLAAYALGLIHTRETFIDLNVKGTPLCWGRNSAGGITIMFNSMVTFSLIGAMRNAEWVLGGSQATYNTFTRAVQRELETVGKVPRTATYEEARVALAAIVKG